MSQTLAPTPTELSKMIGVSVPYASQVLNDRRKPSQRVAIKIFRHTGMKLGPIANASIEQIDALESMLGAA
jgi:transcriptional regulator with XRE-family HTH domain